MSFADFKINDEEALLGNMEEFDDAPDELHFGLDATKVEGTPIRIVMPTFPGDNKMCGRVRDYLDRFECSSIFATFSCLLLFVLFLSLLSWVGYMDSNLPTIKKTQCFVKYSVIEEKCHNDICIYFANVTLSYVTTSGEIIRTTPEWVKTKEDTQYKCFYKEKDPHWVGDKNQADDQFHNIKPHGWILLLLILSGATLLTLIGCCISTVFCVRGDKVPVPHCF